ncbi:MAG: preprotein translocase subunit SecA [Ignavibacteriae bacterium]|nr:preprotein translocase subunit SecA [Ignavibacteriota bacterium]MCB9217221.1 preprotein translocase subunit SecA [Ignavibacteria bacterium]
MLKVIEKIFSSKKEKDVKDLAPMVDEINEVYDEFQSLSDDELKGKTAEFRAIIEERTHEDNERLVEAREQLKEDLDPEDRLALYEEIEELEDRIYDDTQDVLNEILPEAFAVIKEACRRHLGKQWEAGGNLITWDMVHYDVQLIGGMVLHQGKIAEMATGEGKTLVATLPVYLNALPGKGVHIITVNDYLARRDSEWMAPIYQYLGLTVGCIQANMKADLRKIQYGADITFGTNSEFGFDYLRDNMTQRPEDMVQRPHNYAIIDEVDSILIDEARTPLIISGPVENAGNEIFNQMKPRVDRIVKLQQREVAKMIGDAERLLEGGSDEDRVQAGVHLLRAYRGMPKNKKLTKMLQEGGVKMLMEKTEMEYLRDKGARMQEIDDELYYAIDEKQHTIDLSDKGRAALAGAGEDAELFTLPDIATELSMLEGENGEAVQEEAIIERKNEVMQLYSERSELIHTISQLLRAYSLYEPDVEYVVQDNKVKIVDEFTGRILEGRRYSDGLHQAIEAKEGVTVEKDTQTFATVTIQNYFRLYRKLAGMTGTAETEETEFAEIYALDVVVIPTNRPIARDDMNDLIFRTKRGKFNAVIDEIVKRREKGQPVLVGTTSVEVSETLSRMLQRSKVPHSVLNAKQHDREAEVVAKAGQKGAVTIATNMAGRGTDIKLGPGVKEAGGLHILGTERHESRRIDRQLRGRAGRQGDPGSSQFFISLEDNLMRLFGGERVTKWMDRFGASDEVLEAPMLNKAVERAQRKVEENNFSIRKRLLEYDDVMNQQREVVYDRRRHALMGERMKGEIMEYVNDFVDRTLNKHFPEEMPKVLDDIRTKLLIDIDVHDQETAEEVGREVVQEKIIETAHEFYRRKEEHLGSDFMANLERFAVIHIIDDKWREHLREMDDLKQAIGLRAYAQRDPLVEYKKEAYEMFVELIAEINAEIASFAYRYFPQAPAAAADPNRAQRRRRGLYPTKRDRLDGDGGRERTERRLSYNTTSATSTGVSGDANVSDPNVAAATGQGGGNRQGAGATVTTVVREEPKVGRNDPCWCGSGKKYKHCHGRS